MLMARFYYWDSVPAGLTNQDPHSTRKLNAIDVILAVPSEGKVSLLFSTRTNAYLGKKDGIVASLNKIFKSTDATIRIDRGQSHLRLADEEIFLLSACNTATNRSSRLIFVSIRSRASAVATRQAALLTSSSALISTGRTSSQLWQRRTRWDLLTSRSRITWVPKTTPTRYEYMSTAGSKSVRTSCNLLRMTCSVKISCSKQAYFLRTR